MVIVLRNINRLQVKVVIILLLFLYYLLSLHLHKPRFHRMAFPNVHNKMQSYKYIYVCIRKVLSRISGKDLLAVRAVNFLEYQDVVLLGEFSIYSLDFYGWL